ncbi:MAG: hypothetical protein V3U75_13415 [Methylococcaceae bacterium]
MTKKGYDAGNEVALLTARDMELTAPQRASVMQIAAEHKLNIKEASFAYLYALSGDLLGAFHASDYKDRTELAPSLARKAATAIICRPYIGRVVAKIQKENTVFADIDRSFITKELLECLHTAKVNGKVPVIRAVLNDLAKLHGLIIDKAEIDTSHKFQIMDAVTIDGTAMSFDIGNGKVVTNEAVQRSIKNNAPPTIPLLPAIDTNIDELI